MVKKLVPFLIPLLIIVVTSLSAQAKPLKDTLSIAISDDFQPFTFVNAEGEPAGMLVDMWRLWGQKTGKKIEFISSDWKTSLENVKTGKADIHSGLLSSPDRSDWMVESRSLHQTTVSLFFSVKQGRVSDLSQLSGATVAVVRGSQPEMFLQKNYPLIRKLSCDSREELVRATQAGRAKGFVTVSPVGAALIDRLGVSGEFEHIEKSLYTEDLHPGVLRKNSTLAAVIDNGMGSVSNQEWAAIEARWVGVRFDNQPSWAVIRKWALLAGGVFALVLGPTFYWNRRLALQIARQEQVESALQASENQLRVIFETSEAGILRVSPLGVVEFANVQTAAMFGWTLADFIGTSYADHLFDTEKQEVSERMRQLIQGDIRTVGLDRRYRRRDGSDFWGHLSGSRLENSDRSLSALIGIITDITWRKTMEEALVQSNEQLQFVLEGSQLGFWDWNIETGTVGRNDRWAEMLGYTLQEVEFNVRQWTDLIHPDDRKQAWDSINDHLEGRTPFHGIEYRMLTKDGKYKWILDQAQIVERDTNGQPARMCGTHTDITERKLAEQTRIRLQVEEDERSRLSRELHDSSGQSLLAIHLNLMLLAEGKVKGDIREELNMLAREVADTANELREISHQIRPSYLEETYLDTAVAKRCAILRHRGAPVSCTVSGDFSQLPGIVSDNIYRIFQEEVSNACRHSAASKISVSLERTDASLRLIVTDDGCGIGKKTEDPGIGLRIMAERAAIIGATLSVESEATGTTITLTLEER